MVILFQFSTITVKLHIFACIIFILILHLQDANECDEEIKGLREHQVDLSKSLEEKQVSCQQLQGSADTLDGDIEQMLQLKQKVSPSLILLLDTIMF